MSVVKQYRMTEVQIHCSLRQFKEGKTGRHSHQHVYAASLTCCTLRVYTHSCTHRQIYMCKCECFLTSCCSIRSQYIESDSQPPVKCKLTKVPPRSTIWSSVRDRSEFRNLCWFQLGLCNRYICLHTDTPFKSSMRCGELYEQVTVTTVTETLHLKGWVKKRINWSFWMHWMGECDG